MSSGSSATRNARRLPAALTTPRVGEARDHALERRIHLARRHDLVADHAAFRRVAIEPPARHDRLARDAVAGEAPHPHVGGARNDAFLARRQRHVGVARRHHVIHREQILAAAADREMLDARDPRLLDRAAVDLVRADVRPREAAHHLVHEAHLARHVPHVRNLAVIDVGEIDAGREHALAGVFRIVDRVAAQHAQLALRIEDARDRPRSRSAAASPRPRR